jgi:hypothetical protein
MTVQERERSQEKKKVHKQESAKKGHYAKKKLVNHNQIRACVRACE